MTFRCTAVARYVFNAPIVTCRQFVPTDSATQHAAQPTFWLQSQSARVGPFWHKRWMRLYTKQVHVPDSPERIADRHVYRQARDKHEQGMTYRTIWQRQMWLSIAAYHVNRLRRL